MIDDQNSGSGVLLRVARTVAGRRKGGDGGRELMFIDDARYNQLFRLRL